MLYPMTAFSLFFPFHSLPLLFQFTLMPCLILHVTNANQIPRICTAILLRCGRSRVMVGAYCTSPTTDYKPLHRITESLNKLCQTVRWEMMEELENDLYILIS